jgi:hypothetical protein
MLNSWSCLEWRENRALLVGLLTEALVGGVGCSGVMSRARDVASASEVTHPNVKLSHVIGAKRWLGPVMSDIHGLHSVSQLLQCVPKQPGEVARRCLG